MWGFEEARKAWSIEGSYVGAFLAMAVVVFAAPDLAPGLQGHMS